MTKISCKPITPLERQRRQHIAEARRWLKMNCPELSKRELEIVRLLSYGLGRKQVGDILNISPLTVSTHVRNIYQALGFNKETELTRWYIMKCYNIQEKSMFLDFCILIYLTHKFLIR